MNVVDVLNGRNIKYREAGKDYLIRCVNPEHDDNNPSMRIDKVTGIFHCFSCGHKGNIFQHFGAEPNQVDVKIAELQGIISEMLSGGNLEMPSDAVMFNQKYRGIDGSIYEQAEAFLTNEIDELKDRLVFPLKDIRGNIKVFVGRALHSDVEAKYKFYPGNVSPPLFPAHPEIWKNSIIIVEGIFDVLNMMDKGCHNVVCAFGTSTLFKNFDKKLSHFKIMGVNKYYIMFDGDKAGQSAAYKLEELLKSKNINAEAVIIPEDEDPGSLTEEKIEYLMKGLYGNEDSNSRKE